MTEHLTRLLHDETTDLDLPPTPTDVILGRGRRLCRERRTRLVAAGLCTAGLIGALTVGLHDQDDQGPDSAGTPTVASDQVYAIADTVYLPGQDSAVQVDDAKVDGLYSTSAGVVVRHRDARRGGVQRFSLLQEDGGLRPLSLRTRNVHHTSDVDQPYLAYAENRDGRLQVVVYDVVADREAARIDLRPTRHQQFPISLDGDSVAVQNSLIREVHVVDWKDGTFEVDHSYAEAWGRADGRIAYGATVLDAANDDPLLTVDEPGYGVLSPDGEFVQIIDDFGIREAPEGTAWSTRVYEVATGDAVTVTSTAQVWSWNRSDDLFTVTDDGVMTTCDPGSGHCVDQAVDLPPVPNPDIVFPGEVREP